MKWLLRDNYGNPYYHADRVTVMKGDHVELTARIQQFDSKEEAEAFLAMKIVEGALDQGVWQAETTETA